MVTTSAWFHVLNK